MLLGAVILITATSSCAPSLRSALALASASLRQSIFVAFDVLVQTAVVRDRELSAPKGGINNDVKIICETKKSSEKSAAPKC